LLRFDLRSAYTYIWVSAFTRDAGLGLADWIYRINPSWAPYPKTMEIEVTTRCHLRCQICEHTYWKEPARDMSFEELKHIVDQFPDLKWIGLTGIGSSFINKDFMKILRHLKSRNVFIEFFDTFTLVDEKTANELVDIGVDKIWVSFDAATKQTYETIRVGAKYEQVLANIKKLFEIKKTRKRPVPEVWFHYIINNQNVGEMVQYLDLVKSIVPDGANYETLVYFTSLLHFDQVKNLIPTIPQEVKEAVYKRASELGIFVNWNENVSCDKPIQDCTKWVEPFVLVTGHVQPCCAMNMANDREFQKQNAWGNLLKEDFHDIWNSDKVKQFKSEIHSNTRPQVCKNCRIYLAK